VIEAASNVNNDYSTAQQRQIRQQIFNVGSSSSEDFNEWD
jgi:hypothetical protein